MLRLVLTLALAVSPTGCSLVYDSDDYVEAVDAGSAPDTAPAPVCGNDVCEPGESRDTCKDDCDKPDDDDDDN